MGDKTRIDWCDATWNPVSGCLHGCEYCYARGIARRFDGGMAEIEKVSPASLTEMKYGPVRFRHTNTHVLEKPMMCQNIRNTGKNAISPYPFGFDPTFHRYRLDIPKRWTKPRTIFVCSMADLFGEWVPDEWIKDVFDACMAAPQHRYLFLTKNGKRYLELAKKGVMPDRENFWYGCSVTRPDEPFFFSDRYKTFASVEPILEPFDWVPGLNNIELPDWIIVGAETGNRKGKVKPEKDWLYGIVNGCAEHHIPLFMKESLRELMGADFRQEFPWGEV